MSSITVAAITISDSCFEGTAIDSAGELAQKALEQGLKTDFECVVVERHLVPDDRQAIEDAIVGFCDDSGANLVLTLGGTGIGIRDCTPEATLNVIEKSTPGIVHALTSRSLQATPMAALSRMCAGVRGRTLVVNLPGSAKAVAECLEIIIPLVKHSSNLLANRTREIHADHRHIQNSNTIKCKSRVKINPANRPRKSPYPPVKICDAVSLVLKVAKELIVLKSSSIRIENALGYILAEAVSAPISHPSFPASIKDGYAVISADGAGDRIIDRAVTEGEKGAESLVSGRCIRISTGAPVSPGADAVVQVEDTELLDAADGLEMKVRILQAPRVGQDIRPVGSDITEGSVLLPAQTHLGACELALLASMGIATVTVIEKPRVCVLSTGDELVAVSSSVPQRGQIHDSNKLMLQTLLQTAGFDSKDGGIARDNPDDILKAISKALLCSDILITTGGVSMGECDLLKDVLVKDFDFTIDFGRVWMKPGLPTTFARGSVGGKPKIIFCLPGNPVSAFVGFHLFVLPVLSLLTGHNQPQPTFLRVKIAEDIRLDPRPEYRRAKLISCNSCQKTSGFVEQSCDHPPLVSCVSENQVSSRLLSCVGANLLLKLPEKSVGKDVVVKGEIIDAVVVGKL